jgi:hypothetical protein
MIVALQATALAYGVSTAWNSRPVYLVAEVDRFKVITWEEIRHADFSSLPPELQPSVWKPPAIVALRPPVSIEEKNKVLFESLQSGRDYAERPEFYIPYSADSAGKVLARSREITALLKASPEPPPSGLRIMPGHSTTFPIRCPLSSGDGTRGLGRHRYAARPNCPIPQGRRIPMTFDTTRRLNDTITRWVWLVLPVTLLIDFRTFPLAWSV